MKSFFILALVAFSIAANASVECEARKITRQPGVKLENGITSFPTTTENIKLTERKTFFGDYLIDIQEAGEGRTILDISRWMGGNRTEGGHFQGGLPVLLSVDIEGGQIQLSCK